MQRETLFKTVKLIDTEDQLHTCIALIGTIQKGQLYKHRFVIQLRFDLEGYIFEKTKHISVIAAFINCSLCWKCWTKCTKISKNIKHSPMYLRFCETKIRNPDNLKRDGYALEICSQIRTPLKDGYFSDSILC